MARGVLIAQIDPPTKRADEFERWYEHEHIPSRLAVDGFVRATRYRALEGAPSQLTVYELADVAALKHPDYRRLKDEPSEFTSRTLAGLPTFLRYTCEEAYDTGAQPIEATHLALVAFPVPETDAAELAEYYDTEHIPALLVASDWLRVRRYQVLTAQGGPWTHLALHDLASSAVMDSPARTAARGGPRRAALAGRPWFRAAGRWLYKAISSQP